MLEQVMPMVALLVTLSVASERLVEIVKGFLPFLGEEITTDAKKERARKATLQVLAVGAGIITALLAKPALGEAVPPGLQGSSGILALGLLASGGSGFWNAILSYMLQVKEIKKSIAKQEKEREAKLIGD
jgi:hypothetical protein